MTLLILSLLVIGAVTGFLALRELTRRLGPGCQMVATWASGPPSTRGVGRRRARPLASRVGPSQVRPVDQLIRPVDHRIPPSESES